MKKKFFVFYFLLTVIMISCKKNNTPASIVESWSFKGTTYTGNQCFGNISDGNLEVSTNSPNGPNGSLTIWLGNSAAFYGTDTGEFRVVSLLNGNFANGNNQIGIALSGITGVYNTSGGNGSNETIHVGYTNGIISLSGSGIEMVNVVPPYDSSTISLNITQTQ